MRARNKDVGIDHRHDRASVPYIHGMPSFRSMYMCIRCTSPAENPPLSVAAFVNADCPVEEVCTFEYSIPRRRLHQIQGLLCCQTCTCPDGSVEPTGTCEAATDGDECDNNVPCTLVEQDEGVLCCCGPDGSEFCAPTTPEDFCPDPCEQECTFAVDPNSSECCENCIFTCPAGVPTPCLLYTSPSPRD